MKTLRRSLPALLLMLSGTLLVACGDESGEEATATETDSSSGSTSSTNSAPKISGTPSTAVMFDQPYSFTPSADDADGDGLTFSVSNLPRWASFEPATGELSGTPGSGDVGTYSNIRIDVTDGQATASLSAFQVEVLAVANGSATLSWQPPTETVDGSPLADLAGFKVYWGTAPGEYTNEQVIDNPGITTYIVENLAPDTYYFVATAYTGAGMESGPSDMVSKTIM